MLLSDEQQSNSDMDMHIYFFLFQILFHYRLLQDIEYSSLCSALGPWLCFTHSGVYMLILCVCVCVCVRSVMSNSLQPCGLQHARLLCPCDISGKNTGMGCHFLLQGIFLTQRSNSRLLCLLHCRQILYHLSRLGSLLIPSF